jgi:galactose mutarotase-like enzyme
MVEAHVATVTQIADLGEIDGTPIEAYLLESNMPDNNLTAVVTTFGATLLSVKHEVAGKLEEVTLNHKDLASIRNRAINPKYGATCGRTAGRIGKGKFSLPDLDEHSATFGELVNF